MIGEMLKFAVQDVFDTAASKKDADSLYGIFSVFAGGQNATGTPRELAVRPALVREP